MNDLEHVLHDLVTSHGLYATDKPDAPDLFRLDFSESIEILKRAIE
jgi:hypothetical protein